MIDSRRKPRLATSISTSPRSSGPRWLITSVMAARTPASGGPQKPVMPHMTDRAYRPSRRRPREKREDGPMAAARDVIERLLEALNAHDIEAARRLYSPRA